MLDLIKIREDLHQIPELAFEEIKTQSYILEILKRYQEIEIYEFHPTGILAVYRGGKGSFQLFRADMDGLMVEEQTDCLKPSKHKGKMHACGHDMHMSIMLGLIDRVISQKAVINIIFVFQPAEEGNGGALKLLEDEIWNDFDIEHVFALHVSPDLPPGKVSSRVGNFFAATSEYDIKVIGKSSHIATPESGINALKAGVEIYQCIQQLHKVVKSDERFVCDIGAMHSGKIRNAIPANCFMQGTIRAENEAGVKALKDSLTAICETVNSFYKVKSGVKFLVDYKEVYNDPESVELLRVAVKQAGIEYLEADKTMAGEDFGYFCGRWKGVLFWLGAAADKYYPLHSNHFYPDNSAIAYGVEIFWNLVVKLMGT